MAESKVRKKAQLKKQHKRDVENAERRSTQERLGGGASRTWVPWVFVPVGLLGVLWMVVYNLAGNSIGFMAAMGGWNVIIGLGLIIASFSLMTLWK